MSEPRLIRRDEADRVVWGTPETGFVPDIIYHSDTELHVIEFALEPGGRFLHSREKRTVFGADEVFYTLEGSLLLSNPETGEVHPVPAGHSAFFRRNTWHHGFAHRGSVRVLEFMAPPPATGSTQAYARTRPYLDVWKYAEPQWERRWPEGSRDRNPTITVIGPEERLWELGDPRGVLLYGLIAGTEHLVVRSAGIDGDVWTEPTTRDGTSVAVVTDGALSVRIGSTTVTAESGDAVVLPAGAEHSYRSPDARFLVGTGYGAKMS